MKPAEVKPAEVKPIQTPPPVAPAAAAALVWILPPPEASPFDTVDDGATPRPKVKARPKSKGPAPVQAQTFWVQPAAGAWTVAAKRPGLFLAVGDQVVEARLKPYRLEVRSLPKATEDEDEGLAKCRELSVSRLEADGDVLILRNLITGDEREALPAPGSFEELEWVSGHHRQVELLGGLGEHLFWRARVFSQPCGTGGRQDFEFTVFDLTRMEDRTARFLSEDKGLWVKVFELEKRRAQFAPELKKQLSEYETEFNPADLEVAHFWPELALTASDVSLLVTYRYRLGCSPCPQVERRAPTAALPPELASWRTRHPAIDPVARALPATWRVAGITLLTGTPGATAALRARFEAPAPAGSEARP